MKYKQNKGFTLVDTITAIALLAMAVLVVGTLYPTLNMSDLNKSYYLADTIAHSQMDEIRALDFESLTVQSNTSFTHPDLVKLPNGGTGEYTVTLYDGDADGTPDDTIKQVVVTVTWTQNNDIKRRTLTSLLSNTGVSP